MIAGKSGGIIESCGVIAARHVGITARCAMIGAPMTGMA